MTDLQIGLIGIGAIIIIGVVIYNKVQEYRARKEVERAFSNPCDDVLMQNASGEQHEARREPVAEISDLPENTRKTDTFVKTEPVISEEALMLDASVDMDAEEIVPDVSAPPTRGVDELVEYCIPINLEEPVRGEKLMPLLKEVRHAGNKPVSVMGLTVIDGKKQWKSIAHGETYEQLQAGVLLANRSSALNEIEYSELVIQLRQFADAINAEPDFPDMFEVTQHAKSLFQFVAEHDAKLGINVQSHGAPWAAETLMMVLEKQGFELRPDYLYNKRDADGTVLFSLSLNNGAVANTIVRMTLLLDVPVTHPDKKPFAEMVKCAKSLCARLDGVLVDDGNQLLTDEVLADIAEQVEEFYKEMAASSIPAGSPRALKIFN